MLHSMYLMSYKIHSFQAKLKHTQNAAIFMARARTENARFFQFYLQHSRSRLCRRIVKREFVINFHSRVQCLYSFCAENKCQQTNKRVGIINLICHLQMSRFRQISANKMWKSELHHETEKICWRNYELFFVASAN